MLEPVLQAQFVDRTNERNLLTAAVDRVVEQKKGQVIFLSGEAGVGKTRLVDWLLAQLDNRPDVIVARGYCLADISIPYFPFSEAINKLLEQKKHLAPHVIGISGWLMGSKSDRLDRRGTPDLKTERDQMYENMLRLFEKISSGNDTFLLCLEDMHWSDSASLSLLHYLARNIGDSKVLILCTYRLEELADMEPGKQHPLLETLQLMNREHLFEKIELKRLDEPSTKGLLNSMLGSLRSDTIDQLAKDSGGNPFYAVESARYYIRSIEQPVNGIESPEQVLHGNQLELQIPDTIQDIILRRLSRLDRNQRRLIDCASIMGERFDSDLLANTLEIDPLTVVETLDRIVQQTRLLREEQLTFLFDHARIRDVAQAKLSASVKRELHKRLAETMLKKYGDSQTERIVYHFREAGIKNRTTVELSLKAADTARQRYANTEAIDYYTWVINATELSTEEGYPALLLRSLKGRAEARESLGLHERAIEDATELLQKAADRQTRLSALNWAAEAMYARGHSKEALDYITSARKEFKTGVEIERMKMIEARIVGLQGDTDKAIQLYKEATHSFELAGDKKSSAFALSNLAAFQVVKFNLDEAFDSARKAEALYTEIDDAAGLTTHYFNMGTLYMHRGDEQSVADCFQKGALLGEKLGLFTDLSWIYMYWAIFYDAIEKHDLAYKQILRAKERAELTEASYVKTPVYGWITMSARRAGKEKDSQSAYSLMNSLFEQHSGQISRTLQALVSRVRGFYQANLRQWSEADKFYLKSIELISAGGLNAGFHEAETRYDYALLLLEQNRVEEARSQLASCLRLYNLFGNRIGIEKVRRFGLGIASSSLSV